MRAVRLPPGATTSRRRGHTKAEVAEAAAEEAAAEAAAEAPAEAEAEAAEEAAAEEAAAEAAEAEAEAVAEAAEAEAPWLEEEEDCWGPSALATKSTLWKMVPLCLRATPNLASQPTKRARAGTVAWHTSHA